MNDKEKAYTLSKIQKNKFLDHLGMKITDIEAGTVRAELNFAPFLEQQDGWIHGGVISTMCDVVAGFASYSVLEEGERVVTVEIKVSYLNPCRGRSLRAVGNVIKKGGRFHFCESEVFSYENGDWKHCAKASATMAVIRQPKG